MPKVGSAFNIFQKPLAFIYYDLFYIFVANFMRFYQLAFAACRRNVRAHETPKLIIALNLPIKLFTINTFAMGTVEYVR